MRMTRSCSTTPIPVNQSKCSENPSTSPGSQFPDNIAIPIPRPAQERRAALRPELGAHNTHHIYIYIYILTGLDTHRRGHARSYLGRAELGWAGPLAQGAQNASCPGWGEPAQDARTAGSAQHAPSLGKAELNWAAPAAGHAQQASYLGWAGQIWAELGALLPNGAQHVSSFAGLASAQAAPTPKVEQYSANLSSQVKTPHIKQRSIFLDKNFPDSKWLSSASNWLGSSLIRL